MLFCTTVAGRRREPGLIIENRVLTFSQIANHLQMALPRSMERFVQKPGASRDIQLRFDEITRLSQQIGESVEEVSFAPPISFPPKIWCIGLNYLAHSIDIGSPIPDEPTGFMRPSITMLGHLGKVRIPPQAKDVTAEAELGIVMAKYCRDVTVERAHEMVFGYVPVIDMTALDLLEQNPRFITRAKSFDTFFSIGPAIYVPDDMRDLNSVRISTVINGKTCASNTISNMAFKPDFLISFHSKVFPWQACDILSTGTPGAAHIKHGDSIRCDIGGMDILALEIKVS